MGIIADTRVLRSRKGVAIDPDHDDIVDEVWLGDKLNNVSESKIGNLQARASPESPGAARWHG